MSKTDIAQAVSANTIGATTISTSYREQFGSRVYVNNVVFDARIRVRRALNGYILETATRLGEVFDERIASSIEEVRDLIAAEIAAARLEQT